MVWKAFVFAFSMVGMFVCFGILSIQHPDAVAHQGIVVVAANPLEYGQMAVAVDGRTNAYPIPAGTGAVTIGQTVTVWSTPDGTPVTGAGTVNRAAIWTVIAAVGLLGLGAGVAWARELTNSGTGGSRRTDHEYV